MSARQHGGSAASAALDIGGANIKGAHSSGLTFSMPFAVWKAPQELASALRGALASLPPFARLAVTMTAELCDCYETKRLGVLAVLDAVEEAARAAAPGADIRIWTIAGEFAGLEEARADPLRAAAANWLALAACTAASGPRGRCLLADLGSTTLDIVPIADGKPAPKGFTDTERLLAGELVYMGVRRTPIFALCPDLPYRGARCPAIPELFATLADAYVWLGELPEDPGDTGTADGRPLTRQASRDRMARAVGADRETFNADDASAVASAAAEAQLLRVLEALRRQAEAAPEPLASVFLAGEGEFLLRRAAALLRPPPAVHSLAGRFGAAASRAACAHGLIRLLDRS